MDLNAFLTGDGLLVIVLILIAVPAIAYGLSNPRRAAQNLPRRIDKRWISQKPADRHIRAPDPALQLKAVMLSDYRAKQVLSWTEAKVMQAAEAAVHEQRLGWRVLAQVSLGEVLGCDSADGFNAINAKRVDLLLIDRKMMPLAAIEYQGSGHHLDGTAAARDAVKKEALRKAGIGFIEINEEDRPADVRIAIARLAENRAHNAPRATIGRRAAAR